MIKETKQGPVTMVIANKLMEVEYALVKWVENKWGI